MYAKYYHWFFENPTGALTTFWTTKISKNFFDTCQQKVGTFHSSFLRIYPLKRLFDRFELAYDDFVLERTFFNINNNENAETEVQQPGAQDKIITIENAIKEEG